MSAPEAGEGEVKHKYLKVLFFTQFGLPIIITVHNSYILSDISNV